MTKNAELDPRFNAYRTDLADLSLKPFVAASRYAQPSLRQCVRGVVPMYAKPDVGSLRLTEARYGEFLDVFEERDDGFAWVQNRNDRLVGYLPAQGALNEVIAALMNRISVLHTFVYAKPDLKSAVLDRLTLGSYVSLNGETGDFYPLASGGFVFKKHVAPADEVECKDYVFTAGQLLNAPYLTGGRTPQGVDATGLVQLALDLSGIDTPRTYEQQCELFGQPLPCHWRDIVWNRGDIVFFKNPDHVGIMTGFEDVISACPESMLVTVEPLATLVARGYQVVAAGRPA